MIAADGDGYAVVWVEEDGHLQSTRFDPTGKESGGSKLLVAPAKRTDLALIATTSGFELTWSEGESVITLGLTKDALPSGSPQIVGKGHWPRAASAGC